MKNVFRWAAALAAIPLCFASSTRTWTTASFADFEKGDLKGVALRSDGRITLAPRTVELFDSGLAYIWALARDSKGILYAAGGPGARVFRYGGTKFEKVAEFDAVEVHSLAIDAQDRVYAATFPDGKIYRLNPGGKPEEFFNPKCKYIWSMLFDRSGSLLVATGDEGQIFRVTPGGKSSVFFRSDDTHVRSLAFSGPDLIAGTDPTGLVIRVDSKGEGFVLYQLPKREVTSVAVAPDGSIYAAGAGVQHAEGGASALLAAISASRPPSPQITSPETPTPPAGAAPERSAAEARQPRAPALTGGSEVYRIDPTGLPQKVWSHPRDVVYAIGFDHEGHAILGAGNKGTLYRIDTPGLYTSMQDVDANQITALLPEADGGVIAATANVGKVIRFGPELAKSGTVVSEVFDSGGFTTWGRLIANGDASVSGVTLESHSGNLDRPRHYWSGWTSGSPPPARFVQWRATLHAVNNLSPLLDSVEQSYFSRNVAPVVDDIESTPPNYKFPAPILPVLLSRTPTTIVLPPMGKRSAPSVSSIDTDSSAMSYAKGWIGVRWTASDENADSLEYSLQIRGVNETEWKPLKERLIERHYSFDSTSFADGEYRVRVQASDASGNPSGEALKGDLVSSPILIDNTPPVVSGLAVKTDGRRIRANWSARDALSVIKRAEYSVDGGEWLLIDPVTLLSDSPNLTYSLDIASPGSGEHTLAVRVTDEYENVSVEKTLVRSTGSV